MQWLVLKRRSCIWLNCFSKWALVITAIGRITSNTFLKIIFADKVAAGLEKTVICASMLIPTAWECWHWKRRKTINPSTSSLRRQQSECNYFPWTHSPYRWNTRGDVLMCDNTNCKWPGPVRFPITCAARQRVEHTSERCELSEHHTRSMNMPMITVHTSADAHMKRRRGKEALPSGSAHIYERPNKNVLVVL